MTKSWERFCLQILKLLLEQQIALYDWLAETRCSADTARVAQQPSASELSEIPIQAGRTTIESKQSEKVTYRLEMVKCGKLTCRCAAGQLHGSYWYAYQRQTSRVKS